MPSSAFAKEAAHNDDGGRVQDVFHVGSALCIAILAGSRAMFVPAALDKCHIVK